ncbi:hypothetical protein T4B_8995 [Trichinella pseudospiralis]|uniref:Uncharacterized protein n=2 Tax=Trichinella pseudospiralis TaxID=6337 RepID=A0A0V1FXG6_TRIPS|nr:hypothetical protein T4A_9541 [Trichinella pseudospiralis]KRY90019.1 hypothetical protein T4D_14115 [Trichinella pseudospiralis]KRZ24683.1 hypothetical protein T4B_8995 [Trichinella pseudospiralis]
MHRTFALEVMKIYSIIYRQYTVIFALEYYSMTAIYCSTQRADGVACPVTSFCSRSGLKNRT